MWGNDPIWKVCLQMGWFNHQLGIDLNLEVANFHILSASSPRDGPWRYSGVVVLVGLLWGKINAKKCKQMIAPLERALLRIWKEWVSLQKTRTSSIIFYIQSSYLGFLNIWRTCILLSKKPASALRNHRHCFVFSFSIISWDETLHHIHQDPGFWMFVEVLEIAWAVWGWVFLDSDKIVLDSLGNSSAWSLWVYDIDSLYSLNIT